MNLNDINFFFKKENKTYSQNGNAFQKIAL